MRSLLLLVSVLVLGCGTSNGVDGGTGGGTGGGSVGGGTGGGSTGGGGGTGHQVNATTACPHVLLAPALPVTYQGDTTGLPNWVTSQRLEWTDAPDDALRFVAPSTGRFYFTLTSTNRALGVSLKNADGTLHVTQGCPGSGATFMNDGFYESARPTDGGVGYPTSLDAGTEVLIWISAPYWAQVKTGSYTLDITRE